MAFINAFQSGQQFQSLQDQRAQNLRAGEQDILVQQSENERADKSFALREKNQAQLKSERATSAERLAAKDQRAVAERDRVNKERAATNTVNFIQAGIKRGVPINEVIQSASQALTALDIPPEQFGVLAQQIEQDPGVLDQFKAALSAQGGTKAAGPLVSMDIGGKRVVGNLLSDGTFKVLEGAELTSATQADERLKLERQQQGLAAGRLGVAEKAVELKTPEAIGDIALSKAAATRAVATLETDFPTATSAAQGVRNADVSLQLLDEGIRTGSLAAARQGAARFFQDMLGLDDSQVAPTDEFFARSGIAVAQQIQAFGAGTGLSDADRDFAKGIVGGDIALDEKAIRRLLAARRDIDMQTVRNFNKRRDSVLSTASETTKARLPGAVALPGAEATLDDLLDEFAPRGQ